MKEIQEAAKTKGTKVVFQKGIYALGKTNAIELVDECDSLLLDEPKYIDKRHSIGQMIGFTATPLLAAAHASDQHLLNTLNICVHDSGIPAMASLAQEDLSVTDWDAFFSEKQPRVARLVYAAKVEKLEEKLQSLPEYLSITPFSMETYRQLQPDTVTVIDQRHSRGIDFRAATEDGISLLVASQLPNQRALKQLLGRVGRYGQRCSRYLLDTVGTAVDQDEERRQRNAFSTLAEEIFEANVAVPTIMTT